MGQVLSFAFTLRKVGMKKTLKAAELLAVRGNGGGDEISLAGS
jgi:hypothetical protein